MKNIIRFAVFVFVAILTSCSPQEFDKYSLGNIATISDDQFTFSATQDSEYIWTFTGNINIDQDKTPYSLQLNFGDGTASKDLSITHEYKVPAGDYTAALSLYSADGTVLTKSVSIHIESDHPSLEDTTLKDFLSGGKANTSGKVWMLQASEGFGLGPAGSTENLWWKVGATTITDEGGVASAAFDDELTFFFNDAMRVIHDNHGDSFLNESTKALFTDLETDGSFVTYQYTPAVDATWDVVNKDGKDYLILNNAFPMYVVDLAGMTKGEYEIAELKETFMHLIYSSGGNSWHYYLTSEENPEQVKLTGGIDNTNGKKWMLQKSEGFGLGPIGGGWNEWWQVTPDTENAGAAFDDILTFYAEGKKALLENHGDSYMNETTASLFPDGNSSGGFVTTAYTPLQEATWAFDTDDDGNACLILNKVFPMYAVDLAAMESGKYKIMELRDDFLHLTYKGDGVDWNFYLVPTE